MSLKNKTDKIITSAAEKLNFAAAFTLFLMVAVTCLDVLLRGLRHPFPGAYELVGFLGALTVAFSLAVTSLGKGHIAVEYLVRKFPENIQRIIERVNNFIGFIIFSIITWQTFLYAADLMESNEVSMTLQLPLYPFAFGLSAGFFLVSVVMFFQALNLVHYGFSKD